MTLIDNKEKTLQEEIKNTLTTTDRIEGIS